jgi:transposase
MAGLNTLLGTPAEPEVRPNYESDRAAITAAAAQLGIGTAETLRKWARQAQVDGGQRPGATSEESAELKALRWENAALRRANEILEAASALLRGRARRAYDTVVTFVDKHRDHFLRSCCRCRWPG